MKAHLVQREPQMWKRWAAEKIPAQMREARIDAPPDSLHDSPAYANGDIHMGHVMNKVLQEIETGRIPLPADRNPASVSLPPQYRHLAAHTSARRDPNGAVAAAVFWYGGGFPVKHTAFIYGQSPSGHGHVCRPIAKNWHMAGD